MNTYNCYRISLLILTLQLVLLLSGCTRSKDEFAHDLAMDIVTTMNKGSDKKEPNLLSEMTYTDNGKGLTVQKEGMGLFGMALQNSLRVDGYTDGITLDGNVKFDDYNSAFGDLEDQQLQCDMTLHFPNKSNEIDYIVEHVKGTIELKGHEPVDVDYKFKIKNPKETSGFDVGSVDIISGEIEQGDKIYKVK